MVDIVIENRISPQTESKNVTAVEEALFAGKLNATLKKYQTAIHLNPLDDGLLVQRAKFYIQLAKSKTDKSEQRLIFQLALRDYGNAIRLARTKANYYTERAEVYHQLKYFEQAVADCLQANQLSPDNSGVKEKLKKLQLLKRQATVAKSLKQIKRGIDIIVGGILSGLAAAFIWGMGEIAYGVPFMLTALGSFVYGIVKVLKNEISLYELQKQR